LEKETVARGPPGGAAHPGAPGRAPGEIHGHYTGHRAGEEVGDPYGPVGEVDGDAGHGQGIGHGRPCGKEIERGPGRLRFGRGGAAGCLDEVGARRRWGRRGRGPGNLDEARREGGPFPGAGGRGLMDAGANGLKTRGYRLRFERGRDQGRQRGAGGKARYGLGGCQVGGRAVGRDPDRHGDRRGRRQPGYGRQWGGCPIDAIAPGWRDGRQQREGDRLLRVGGTRFETGRRGVMDGTAVRTEATRKGRLKPAVPLRASGLRRDAQAGGACRPLVKDRAGGFRQHSRRTVGGIAGIGSCRVRAVLGWDAQVRRTRATGIEDRRRGRFRQAGGRRQPGGSQRYGQVRSAGLQGRFGGELRLRRRFRNGRQGGGRVIGSAAGLRGCRSRAVLGRDPQVRHARGTGIEGPGRGGDGQMDHRRKPGGGHGHRQAHPFRQQGGMRRQTGFGSGSRQRRQGRRDDVCAAPGVCAGNLGTVFGWNPEVRGARRTRMEDAARRGRGQMDGGRQPPGGHRHRQGRLFGDQGRLGPHAGSRGGGRHRRQGGEETVGGAPAVGSGDLGPVFRRHPQVCPARRTRIEGRLG